MAFVPGGGLPHVAVADMIADITNRYVGVWHASPPAAQIEATVVRWFCEMVGYPSGAGGLLTTGGSLANWTALVTARRCQLRDDFLKGVIYTSDQAHHSVIKAALLAGFPSANVRSLPVDVEFRVRVDKLAEQIELDRQAGWRPFCIVGHAGTVNTGAVDDLSALADVAQREGLWFHVDGAYGGFFVLTDRGRQILRGIERANSITLDPHKGLFLPYGTGGLLVRDRDTLHRAHSLRGTYIPPAPDDPEFVDFSDISPEMSRAFRGLRVWLPVKLHGVGPFRRNLDEKLDLARWAFDELRKLARELPDELKIVAEPQLSLLAFRLIRRGLTDDENDRLNEQLRDRINASGRVWLSPTRLNGRYVIRICILSFRTHREHVQQCVDAIRQAALIQ
jgi:aromatic-L-amino-acid decarboxylase